MRVAKPLLGVLAALALVALSVLAAMALLGGGSAPPEADRVGRAAPAANSVGDRGRSTTTSPAEGVSAPASPGSRALLDVEARSSWATLASRIPAQLGLAVAPLGPGAVRSFGTLRTGHAWSSFKVPILVNLMREKTGRSLSAEESAWARAALTASDNAAAASLFDETVRARGGLPEASLAVEELLGQAGDSSTRVATAPPPPGAVSTWGQTEWSLSASVDFYRALGRGCLLDPEKTDYVLGLMEEVVPEQRWGLAEAGFPPAWQVALKAGWGPDGSESGPYLVRQSGIVRSGESGIAVTIIAQADSGSFESGIEAVTTTASWLRQNLRSLGPPVDRRC